ncbi:MAG: hypothetical protein MUF35_09040 [Candidatus Nanopelagicales bacterium]|jgi:hypothetical protein|nr:hypothetical protein [Candidatus Nanopelagicales bacterium]
MAQDLICCNQQWVGDHSEEWFRQREPLAMAVIGSAGARLTRGVPQRAFG